MYQDWITHTWNPLAGECMHRCGYCQVQKNKKHRPVLNKKYSGVTRLDEKCLKDNLHTGNFIFVCNQQDLFIDGLDCRIVLSILKDCSKFDNKYFFQSKDPANFYFYKNWGMLPKNSVFCTTIETNRDYPKIFKNAPLPKIRAVGMMDIYLEKYVTIEPIIDFDTKEFVKMISMCNPKGVFIGADSCGCKLPEPPKEKIIELISELEKFTEVKQKSNLKRLLK